MSRDSLFRVFVKSHKYTFVPRLLSRILAPKLLARLRLGYRSGKLITTSEFVSLRRDFEFLKNDWGAHC